MLRELFANFDNIKKISYLYFVRRSLKQPFLHVGFAHSGTTSLQQNLFSRRSDLYFVPNETGEHGGILSAIKYLEESHYNPSLIRGWCVHNVFDKMQQGQRLVISDETIVDQPALYFTPAMMPIKTIAWRLHELFGDCKVLFTIRNQYKQVVSTYNVLKRNSIIEGVKVPPFDTWFKGNFTQDRSLFMRNLDFSHAIQMFENLFGAKNIVILPLEIAEQYGAEIYLKQLSTSLDLSISAEDWENYISRNVSQKRVKLTNTQRNKIASCAAIGNAWIEKKYNIPLSKYNYPVMRD